MTKRTSSRETRKQTKKLQPAIIRGDSEPNVVPSFDQIARRAYSYWETRGGNNGSAEDDWLRAERELLRLAKAIDLREETDALTS